MTKGNILIGTKIGEIPEAGHWNVSVFRYSFLSSLPGYYVNRATGEKHNQTGLPVDYDDTDSNNRQYFMSFQRADAGAKRAVDVNHDQRGRGSIVDNIRRVASNHAVLQGRASGAR
jgi:hypothetical protein